ncbi:O-antigen ligase family protein [Candidatus Parcubacteria bacterium]|nr:O-antigen ligase family protein [Patescibacteria group bacterium]MBU4309777.1 O-antigen ligase family protein [Patescibacteria group bacterium]MBU4431783.1 O-antigen ligase family protein [Patescibacteria group bacterium]MBU4578116.1 O-antigen ligase family protein [Patescibacteria group bacterium]MCG2696653.1 O-antigen ligase family protein [Candidatus Parcubacteria bacterium]
MNKIIEKLIYAVAFFLPLQTRWIIKAGEINGGYSEYKTMSLYGIDILILVLLAVFVFYSFKKEKTVKVPFMKNALLSLVGGLEFIVFMSIFAGFDSHIALFLYGRFLLAIGLFFVLVKFPIEKVRVIFWLAMGIFAQAALAIWQFLSQSSFAYKWLGLASHNPSDAGVSVVEVLGGDGIWQRWLRAYGGQDHPNILGGLLVVGILFLLFAYIKTLNKEENIANKIFLLFSFLYFTSLLALFFTFSRTAWLGLALGVATMLAVAVVKKNLLVYLQVLKIILFSGILFAVFYSQFGLLVDDRLFGNTRLENISSSERSGLISDSIGIIKEKWFFGVGLGNYTLAEKAKIPDQVNWFYQPVHNSFLLVWAEVGLFGFILFISLLQFIFGELFERAKRNQVDLYQIGIFLPLIFMMMFDHWWWSLHMGVILFWFALGMLHKNEKID